MADQIREWNMNNTPLSENAYNTYCIKEEHQQDYFVDDKVQISETGIVTDNSKFQDHILPDNSKQYTQSTMLDNINIKVEFSSSEVEYDMKHDNPKIEEGSSADDIKTELNIGFLYCEDCLVYCERYCTECDMLVHILNKTVPINADNISREELPHDGILEIQHYFGEFHVLALKSIPFGVRFGPFTGFNRTERSWKIKGGKFVVDNDKAKSLSWMQYISPAGNIFKQNLRAFQYEHNLYYESTRQIQAGDELLVYFGDGYEDSLNRNVEMDFIPAEEHNVKDAFACTFCCLGFSSESYLSKHKAICPENVDGEFTIEELTQCPTCKIHLDRKEYLMHHADYCCGRSERKSTLPTVGNLTTQADRCKTRSRQIYECHKCRYRTKCQGDLNKHTGQHHEVKMFKCEACRRRFKTREVLRLHVKNTHIGTGEKEDSERSTGIYTKADIKAEHSCSQNETKQFKCSLCEFRTKYKASLKIHMAVQHLIKFTYKCDMCSYKTNRKPRLNVHTKAEHFDEFKYKCDTCAYKTRWKCNLKTHIDTRHLKEVHYKCDTCDYKTHWRSNLKTHIETKHLREFKYKCDRCEYKSNLKSKIKTHIEAKHLKGIKHKCEMCDYETNVKYNLRLHIHARHLKVFRYKCDTCDYKTNVRYNLKLHIETKHLNVFKYKCDACDYKTHWMSNLKTHIGTKHLREFKYKCDTCDFKTIWRSALKAHRETKHLNEFKYKCDRCDYKTNLKSRLKAHVETKHTKEVKHKCDTCDFETIWKSGLKTHTERQHVREFKHKCDACDYKANLKSNLQRHIKTKHLKEFKHKCDTCDYKTNVKSNLDKHIEGKHLKEVKYTCETCDYKTIWKSALKAHVRTRHLKEFK